MFGIRLLHLTVSIFFILSIAVSLFHFDNASAITSTTTIRPNSDITSNWGTSGTFDLSCGPGTLHCSLIDETVANDADYVQTGGNNIDEYGLSDVTGGQTATNILLRVRARTFATGGASLLPTVRIGGALQTSGSFTMTTSFAWYEKNYTGTWTQAQINGMSAYLTKTFDLETDLVSMLEVVVTWTSPSQNQEASRVYANANSLTPGAPLAVTNAKADVLQNTQFRIRMGITVSDIAWNTGAWGTYGNGYSLVYAQKSAATCATQVTGWGTVQSGTGAIQWFDNAAVANGATISSYAQDPTTSGTKVYEMYRESNSLTNNVAIPLTNTGIWDFSLVSAASTTPGTSFCFKVIKNDATDLAAYAVYPEVVITGDYGVGIVDAGGVEVISPLVTFAAGTVTTSQCSLQAATLGTSSQKIRINNDLVTNGWNVSMAATGGPTALWTSGSNTYDFNDPSGSPGGCGDGGDADSVAGQLRVNPTTQTVTPKAGCTTTGLSTGADAKFSQGVTDSITLSAATGSSGRFCYWDITNIPLEQRIPPATSAGSYTIDMTVTMTAL